MRSVTIILFQRAVFDCSWIDFFAADCDDDEQRRDKILHDVYYAGGLFLQWYLYSAAFSKVTIIWHRHRFQI